MVTVTIFFCASLSCKHHNHLPSRIELEDIETPMLWETMFLLKLANADFDILNYSRLFVKVPMKIFQKRKTPFLYKLFLKTFQISSNYFSFHKHFN